MGKDDMQIKNKRIKSLKKYFSLLISITFYLFSSLSLHNYKPESCLHSKSYPPYHVLSILVVQYVNLSGTVQKFCTKHKSDNALLPKMSNVSFKVRVICDIPPSHDVLANKVWSILNFYGTQIMCRTQK